MNEKNKLPGVDTEDFEFLEDINLEKKALKKKHQQSVEFMWVRKRIY